VKLFDDDFVSTFSSLGKGIMRLGITSFAYPSLSTANPKDFLSIYTKLAKSIEERKKSGNLPPGLAEQLDMQLAAVKNAAIPDLELVAFPGFFTTSCKHQISFVLFRGLMMILQPNRNRGRAMLA
jgi:hypothetical protein